MGDPFSAAFFALALRRAVYEIRQKGIETEGVIQLICSYLDEWAFGSDFVTVEDMIPVATEDIAKIGLSLSVDNTIPLFPMGIDLTNHPRLQQLGENNKDGNGLLMCGQPLDGNTTLLDQPLGAIPVGNESFTPRFRQEALDKTNANLNKCRSMSLNVAHDIPTVQNVKLLIRGVFAVRYQKPRTYPSESRDNGTWTWARQSVNAGLEQRMAPPAMQSNSNSCTYQVRWVDLACITMQRQLQPHT